MSPPVSDCESATRKLTHIDDVNKVSKLQQGNVILKSVWKYLVEEKNICATDNTERSNDNILLNVEYISERQEREDDITSRDLHSCIEMVLKYWGRGTDIRSIVNQNIDCCSCVFKRKGLNRLVARHGTKELLEHELENKRPVLVKWKANGSIMKPCGDHHWSVLVGRHNDYWIHNDPMGLADMINGGYISSTGGKQALYDKDKWLSRWIIDGEST